VILRHAEICRSAEREQGGHDRHRDDEPEPPPHQRAAPVTRQCERHCEQHEDEHDEHDAQPVEQVYSTAGLLELTGVEELDLEVLLLLGETVEHGDAAFVESLHDLVDDRREVEDDLAILDGDVLSFVGQSFDHASVRTPVGIPPHGRELLGRESPLGGVVHEGLHTRADWTGEELRSFRERVLRLSLDVDRREEAVGGAVGHHVGDRLVRRQRRNRVDVLVGVEDEVADPDRQPRQRHQHHAHDHEDRDQGASPPRQPARGL